MKISKEAWELKPSLWEKFWDSSFKLSSKRFKALTAKQHEEIIEQVRKQRHEKD